MIELLESEAFWTGITALVAVVAPAGVFHVRAAKKTIQTLMDVHKEKENTEEEAFKVVEEKAKGVAQKYAVKALRKYLKG